MRGIDWNHHWKFILGDTEGGHLLETSDQDWRSLSLPHDWSVEFSFDQEKGEACTGFLLGGIGWYRKHFVTEEAMVTQKVFVNFDGIYNRATIYCNGQLVAFHPYGYTPRVQDLTDYLNPIGEDNVIAVKVDHSRYADSRWYTGSGIYRKVSLHLLPKVHIPVWGTFYKTLSATEEAASIEGHITLKNDGLSEVAASLVTKLYDPNHDLVEEIVRPVSVAVGQQKAIQVELSVKEPILWDIYKGHMYEVVNELLVDDQVLQVETTKIGIRVFEFDTDRGFFINGRWERIKGVCLHHDGGLVGAAVPKDVWRRRFETLVAGGCNAIRTAHNPASEDFLDLCDEMGLLVQEEFFDEWDNPKDKRNNGVEKFVDDISRGHAEFFREYAKKDLQDTMLRDRNHPSIIQWSIGNEIEWTYTKYNDASGYFGIDTNGFYFWNLPPYSRDEIARRVSKVQRDYYDVHTTAKKLADWTKEMDTSRPVTANCILPTVSYESGYCDALDLVGYSYRRVIYGYGHDHFGHKPIMGTENVPQWHEWKAVLENDHIPGIFLWTGIDHMGEAQAQGTPFPRKGSNVGILDLAGFPKPAYHMYKSLWLETAQIHMVTQTLQASLYQLNSDNQLVEKEEGGWQQRLWFWHEVNQHFNYDRQTPIVVEVYSNCPSVTLYHNEINMGCLQLEDFEDHIYKWLVPYEPGQLKAVGHGGDEEVTYIIETAGEPSQAILHCDKKLLTKDGDSVAHIEVELLDDLDHPVTHKDLRINFDLVGPGRILGVDNGHPDNVNDFQADTIMTSEGKALMILQGTGKGEVQVKAYSKERPLKTRTISLVVE